MTCLKEKRGAWKAPPGRNSRREAQKTSFGPRVMERIPPLKNLSGRRKLGSVGNANPCVVVAVVTPAVLKMLPLLRAKLGWFKMLKTSALASRYFPSPKKNFFPNERFNTPEAWCCETVAANGSANSKARDRILSILIDGSVADGWIEPKRVLSGVGIVVDGASVGSGTREPHCADINATDRRAGSSTGDGFADREHIGSGVAHAIGVEYDAITGRVAVRVGIDAGLQSDRLSCLCQEDGTQLIPVQNTLQDAIFRFHFRNVIRPRESELVPHVQIRAGHISRPLRGSRKMLWFAETTG